MSEARNRNVLAVGDSKQSYNYPVKPKILIFRGFFETFIVISDKALHILSAAALLRSLV